MANKHPSWESAESIQNRMQNPRLLNGLQDYLPGHMSQVPKCTSWRGHKFEARYDKGAVSGRYHSEGGSEAHIEATAEKMRPLTYVRDICVRCGHIIERRPG